MNPISTYFENNNSEWSNSREKILLWINFKLGLLILSLIVSSSEFYGTILCKASDSISKEGIFPFFFYLRHTPHSTIISFFPFKEEHEIKNTVKTIVNVFSQKKRSSLKSQKRVLLDQGFCFMFVCSTSSIVQNWNIFHKITQLR